MADPKPCKIMLKRTGMFGYEDVGYRHFLLVPEPGAIVETGVDTNKVHGRIVYVHPPLRKGGEHTVYLDEVEK
jgi:hypothetical protein